MLKTDTHALRALEPSDSAFLFQLENASDEWWLGATIAPLGLAWMLDAQVPVTFFLTIAALMLLVVPTVLQTKQSVSRAQRAVP